MKRRYAGLITLYILVVLISVFAGNRAASAADILRVLAGDGTSSHGIILFQVRLPRIIAASGCGAALAAAGFLLQGSLDNRIASPGILGINNGAGLFVLISAWFFPFRPEIKCVMAFFGALTVTLLISLLTIRTGMSKTSVILSGVAISALSVSLIDVIISIKPETVADRVAFQIGGFSTVNIRAVWFAIPLILTGLIASFLLAPSMDILALGDETAQGLGLNAKQCRYLLILCAALLSGASVSMSGLLGFVGLIVPNCVRMMNYRKSRDGVALCAICGAAFLLLCDTASRLLFFPYELPCGLLLSLIGAPFLIAILAKRRKRLGTD